jgi:hypothetical protein
MGDFNHGVTFCDLFLTAKKESSKCNVTPYASVKKTKECPSYFLTHTLRHRFKGLSHKRETGKLLQKVRRYACS